MNLERIRQLRDFIEAVQPEACDMKHWFYKKAPRTDGKEQRSFSITEHRRGTCGTAGCLAGHAKLLQKFLEAPGDEDKAHNVVFNPDNLAINAISSARDWLELTTPEAEKLFYGWWSTFERFARLPEETKQMYYSRKLRDESSNRVHDTALYLEGLVAKDAMLKELDFILENGGRQI